LTGFILIPKEWRWTKNQKTSKNIKHQKTKKHEKTINKHQQGSHVALGIFIAEVLAAGNPFVKTLLAPTGKRRKR